MNRGGIHDGSLSTAAARSLHGDLVSGCAAARSPYRHPRPGGNPRRALLHLPATAPPVIATPPAVNMRIPEAFLFDDVHADYHQPTGTPDRIDYGNLHRVVRLLLRRLDEVEL